jgi:hypothetical protein
MPHDYDSRMLSEVFQLEQVSDEPNMESVNKKMAAWYDHIEKTRWQRDYEPVRNMLQQATAVDLSSRAFVVQDAMMELGHHHRAVQAAPILFRCEDVAECS